jgi:hypothetical protein
MDFQNISNFKLFSKPVAIESNSVLNIGKSKMFFGYYIFAVVLFGICGFIYYRQNEIKNMLNSWIGKLWLSTHLTSDGELTSTYVPAKFSLFSKITSVP